MRCFSIFLASNQCIVPLKYGYRDVYCLRMELVHFSWRWELSKIIIKIFDWVTVENRIPLKCKCTQMWWSTFTKVQACFGNMSNMGPASNALLYQFIHHTNITVQSSLSSPHSLALYNQQPLRSLWEHYFATFMQTLMDRIQCDA